MQSLILIMKSGGVVVPASMVAQIVGRQPVAEYETALPSVRKSIIWRDHTIPLVFCSELWGDEQRDEQGADEDASRAVVLWPLQGRAPGEMIALSSLGSPRLVQVENNSALLDTEQKNDYVLGAMRIESGIGIIPDLVKLSDSIYLQ